MKKASLSTPTLSPYYPFARRLSIRIEFSTLNEFLEMEELNFPMNLQALVSNLNHHDHFGFYI